MPVITQKVLNPVTKSDLQLLRTRFRRANTIADAAFLQTVRQLDQKYIEIFYRAGYFDGFPFSDIVDTGKLVGSQSFSSVGAGKVEFTWDAVTKKGVAYASFVHDGYTLRNGLKQKGRPWTVEVQNEFNFAEEFEENLSRYFPS